MTSSIPVKPARGSSRLWTCWRTSGRSGRRRNTATFRCRGLGDCFNGSSSPIAAKSPCASCAPAGSWALKPPSSPVTWTKTRPPPAWPTTSFRWVIRGVTLDGRRIVAAAKEWGADAIHPGYGFLAENPAFARQCAAAGIVFVGPSAEVMEHLGEKDRARAAAKSWASRACPAPHRR